jgi:hypothetical protein
MLDIPGILLYLFKTKGDHGAPRKYQFLPGKAINPRRNQQIPKSHHFSLQSHKINKGNFLVSHNRLVYEPFISG